MKEHMQNAQSHRIGHGLQGLNFGIGKHIPRLNATAGAVNSFSSYGKQENGSVR